MTAMTSRGLTGNPRTMRDEVSRVIGGRGWRGDEKLEGTAWRPAIDISGRRDLLILDLSHVPSCDAAGLAVLIGTRRRARPLGISMRLAAPSLPVRRVLRSTGLYRSFTIYLDLSGALAPERHEPATSAPDPALPAAGQCRSLVPGARSA